MWFYERRIFQSSSGISVRFSHLLITIQILLFSLMFCDAVAQETDDTDYQTWLDYKAFYQVSDKIQFDGDLGIRGVISDEDWTQIFLRPSFVRRNKT